MTSARQTIGGAGPGGGALPIARALQGALIAGLSICVVWIAWLYGNGLRDARYFDGWVLAAGMALQVLFHISAQRGRTSPKALMRWRAFHIFLGYVLLTAFLSHTRFKLPDTALEWALWTAFVLVAASGVLGTYLAWSLKAKHGMDVALNVERIQSWQEDLARAVQMAVTPVQGPPQDPLALPAPPYEAWSFDLFSVHLRYFFDGSRNSKAHLLGSQRHVTRLLEEIDMLSGFVDAAAQDRLKAIRELVIEKDRLDFALAYRGLMQGWMLVHLPATYALVLLTVLHAIVVYAFSSGAW